MPLVYRSMVEDQDGKPKIGRSASTLGIRISPIPNPDITVTTDDHVEPMAGGMSVAPNWHDLPYFLIPTRLRAIVPGARGTKPNLRIWKFGEGPFVYGKVAEKLVVRPDPQDPEKHGFIEPEVRMLLAEYEGALGATRDHWIIDET